MNARTLGQVAAEAYAQKMGVDRELFWSSLSSEERIAWHEGALAAVLEGDRRRLDAPHVPPTKRYRSL